jgi:TolB-like protein
MLSVIAAAMLTAAPLVVVLPFEVKSIDPADADLGLAMQSLVVHELSAVAINSRTEDADLNAAGKIAGATHVATGTIVRMGKDVLVSARLIDPKDNKILAVTLLRGPALWNDRRQFTSKVVEKLGVPMPARPDGYDVNEDLARAWGAALRALKSGDPTVAKDKVSAVVEKWPQFMPAKAQLAKL